MLMIAMAILLSQVLAATPVDSHKNYEKCIIKQTGFYAKFCYPIPDIVMAVRGVCRSTVSDSLEKKLMQLDAHSKGEIIRLYMSTMDEVIYRVAMDTRIQQKVDCGQFNDASPKDIVDTRTKKSLLDP
jgi:hypothetical protein